MNDLKKAPKAPVKFEHAGDKALGLVTAVGGLALMDIGYEGIDNHEARTPEDAIGSISIADHYVFVTKADLPYAGSFLLGAALASAGLYKLLHRKQ